MSAANGYKAGDVIRVENGTDVVQGRYLITEAGHIKVRAAGVPFHLNTIPEDGAVVSLVERAHDPLPTEPGTVIAIGDWWLIRLRPYAKNVPAAWELLPQPADVTRRIQRLAIKTQCVYGDDWVQAEVDQDPNGFRIISKPVQS
jgi:hypothetical protein